MAIQFGNDKIKEIYFGSHKIKEVYHGSELVWSGSDAGLYQFINNEFVKVASGNIEDVSGDGAHGYISDGRLFMRGSNDLGQLGLGFTGARIEEWTQVGSDNDWEKILARPWHSAAIKGGKLYATGSGKFGRLGQGNEIDSNVFLQIGSFSDWVSLAGGDAHTLALRTNGSIYAWGLGSGYRLGTGSAANQLSPIQIVASGAIEIASSDHCGAYITKNRRSIITWGSNTDGISGTTGGSKITMANLGTSYIARSLSIGSKAILYIRETVSSGVTEIWGRGRNGGYSLLPPGQALEDELISHRVLDSGKNFEQVVFGVS